MYRAIHFDSFLFFFLTVIRDADMATLSHYLTMWESLRPVLGLTHQQEEVIRQAYPEDYEKQKRKCLEVWKEMKGNNATYSALITAAEKTGNQWLTDEVKDMLYGMYMYMYIVYTHWEGGIYGVYIERGDLLYEYCERRGSQIYICYTCTCGTLN